MHAANPCRLTAKKAASQPGRLTAGSNFAAACRAWTPGVIHVVLVSQDRTRVYAQQSANRDARGRCAQFQRELLLRLT